MVSLYQYKPGLIRGYQDLTLQLLNFTFLIYSQVEPTADNLAANMLAKSIQIRNQRKVKVNAQVTFVIYVLAFDPIGI